MTPRTRNRIGLILMAGDAFVQAPMTNDYSTLRSVLDQSGPKSISLGGTNIPAAVNMAVAALEKSEVKNKAVVIISDGENLEGQAIPAVPSGRLSTCTTWCCVDRARRRSAMRISVPLSTTTRSRRRSTRAV